MIIHFLHLFLADQNSVLRKQERWVGCLGEDWKHTNLVGSRIILSDSRYHWNIQFVKLRGTKQASKWLTHKKFSVIALKKFLDKRDLHLTFLWKKIAVTWIFDCRGSCDGDWVHYFYKYIESRLKFCNCNLTTISSWESLSLKCKRTTRANPFLANCKVDKSQNYRGAVTTDVGRCLKSGGTSF